MFPSPDVTKFSGARVHGSGFCNYGAYAAVICRTGNPSSITSMYIPRRGTIPAMCVTGTSVEYVVVRGTAGCAPWLARNSEGYLKPCCDEWYACFDFKRANSQCEIFTLLAWLVEKAPARSLADCGLSDKVHTVLWREAFKYKNRFERERLRDASNKA